MSDQNTQTEQLADALKKLKPTILCKFIILSGD